MIRRLNFTGRKKISRSRVTIRLMSEHDLPDRFTANFDLSGLRFPASARLLIEAFNALSYMRFEFGTVGSPQAPSSTWLSDVTRRPLPKFRLKVVDDGAHPGLLLGVADRILPLREDQDESERQPLLPVEFCDLGDRIWNLDLTDWPVLELNQHVDGLIDEARSGDGFLALVYPEVVRQILRTIVVDHQRTDPAEDETEWGCLWLRYACTLPGVNPPPSGMSPNADAEREEWLHETVQAFCREREVRKRFGRALQPEGEG